MPALSPFAAALLARDVEINNHPRARELLSAMIDARRWAEPLYYTAKQAGIDHAELTVRPSESLARSYWERVALRALIMLDMTPEQRAEAIAAATTYHKEAERTLTTALPSPVIDLSKIKI